MKQVIPFTKDIVFNTKISEITSISLEHDYNINDGTILGNFIISGDYKIHDASIEKENFSYNVPFDIDLTSRYDVSNSSFDIEDFYYEIIDNNTMRCHIEVSLDALEEKKEEVEVLDDVKVDGEEKLETFSKKISGIEFEEDNANEETIGIRDDIEVIEVKAEPEEEIVEEVIEELINNPTKQTEQVIEEVIEDKNINTNTMNTESLKKLFDEETDEVFSTYKVYIIRENDTVETIIKKYGVTKEILSEYNNIDNIKLNDKIIVPYLNE